MASIGLRARWGGAGALALALAGCGDDGSAEGSSGTTVAGTAGSGPGTTASDDDPTAASVDEGTSTATSTDPTTPGTTGDEPLCNGWSDDGPTTPWLMVYGRGHEPLRSGGTFPIECGGQGSWMFPIYPEMGGWDLAGTSLSFEVEVVVEGFPGSTGGSFFQDEQYPYDLECFDGGSLDGGGFVHDCIAVLPPDGIDDLALLDGAPATIHVALDTQGGDPLVIDLVDMTLSAPPDEVMLGCFL